MFRRLGLLLLFALMALPVFAQQNQNTADYAIRNIRSRFTNDGKQTEVQFEVWNIGGAATQQATATLIVIATGQQVATDLISPLRSQEIVTVSLNFPSSLFTSNSVESFRAAIGVDEVEATGSQNIQNNFAQISITFPETISGPLATEEAPSDVPSTQPQGDIVGDFVQSLNDRITSADPQQLAFAGGIVIAVIILLIIIVIIIRVIFQRPPDMGNWQPPYANMPPLDPNSPSGRRQQWQLHAQNASLGEACADGSLHVRKLMTGVNKTYLSGWKVIAIRMSQYDMYGRVNRSTVFAQPHLIKRLNGIMKRRDKLAFEKVAKQVRPIAAGMVADFKGKLNDRNVMLPIALDIRLQGKHGEVRIVFELFQCEFNHWSRLDQWEPDMTVISKAIQDSYTYTLYGQQSSETFKSFRLRLMNDVTQALTEAVKINAPTPPPQKRDETPTNPHLEAVNIPNPPEQ